MQSQCQQNIRIIILRNQTAQILVWLLTPPLVFQAQVPPCSKVFRFVSGEGIELNSLIPTDHCKNIAFKVFYQQNICNFWDFLEVLQGYMAAFIRNCLAPEWKRWASGVKTDHSQGNHLPGVAQMLSEQLYKLKQNSICDEKGSNSQSPAEVQQ